MVGNVTSLTGKGLRDWLLQRMSAVVLAMYTLFLAGFIYTQPELNFQHWHQLFQHLWMQIASLLVVVSLAIHAWIGIWTVTTDYLKSTGVRILVQFVVFVMLFFYILWGIVILWGL